MNVPKNIFFSEYAFLLLTRKKNSRVISTEIKIPITSDVIMLRPKPIISLF
jgi:hypothetical protein